MAMTTTTGGALVSGAPPQGNKAMATVSVKALRGFYLKGDAVATDQVVEVSETLARELIASNKAARAAATEAKPAKATKVRQARTETKDKE